MIAKHNCTLATVRRGYNLEIFPENSQRSTVSKNNSANMRFSTTLVLLAASLVGTQAALHSRQTRDVSDSSYETDELNQMSSSSSSLSLLRNDLGPEGRGGLAYLCPIILRGFTQFIPAPIVTIMTALLVLPPAILIKLITFLVPGENVDLVSMLITCLRKVNEAQLAFGDNPSTAIAKLEGTIQGEINFVQTQAFEDNPRSVSIIAALEGLAPGSYSFSIHESGDISHDCSTVGEQFSNLGGNSFTVAEDGKAVLLLQEAEVELEGTSSVMGRSVVVTPEGGGVSTCGVIVRNVAKLNKF